MFGRYFNASWRASLASIYRPCELRTLPKLPKAVKNKNFNIMLLLILHKIITKMVNKTFNNEQMDKRNDILFKTHGRDIATTTKNLETETWNVCQLSEKLSKKKIDKKVHSWSPSIYIFLIDTKTLLLVNVVILLSS